MRMVAVRVPDWPVVAWGIPADEPGAVLVANRVIAATERARSYGITTGMRRRQAQGIVPELLVNDRDPVKESRAFEPLMARLDAITPRVEIPRPGRCGFAAKGPTRYFGGEKAVTDLVRTALEAELDGLARVRVGVADGPFAADRAARAAVDAPLIVAPGATPTFLSGLSISVLGRPELAEVLMRLGIRTLGQFSALDPADVSARFGSEGLTAWRLSWGEDGRLLNLVEPPEELTVTHSLDPPAERVETAAFVVSGMAASFAEGLASRGLACTRMVIAAETEHGERIERCWTHDVAATQPLSATAIAQRLRWQMDGWLSARGDGGAGRTAHRVPVAERLTGGISRLQIIPEQVVAATGRQLGFWGGEAGDRGRVMQAMARIQGLLGEDSVRVVRSSGGRNPGDDWQSVPAAAAESGTGTSGTGASGGSASGGSEGAPWPSRLPSPSPAIVRPGHLEPVGVQLLDRHRREVKVSGRGGLSAPPALVSVDGGPLQEIERWAGPWPCDERWWDPLHGRRRARIQAVTADGIARLLSLEAGRWCQEAIWD